MAGSAGPQQPGFQELDDFVARGDRRLALLVDQMSGHDTVRAGDHVSDAAHSAKSTHKEGILGKVSAESSVRIQTFTGCMYDVTAGWGGTCLSCQSS